MKKLIGALVALFATTAFGATLNPIQSLNPAGSTAGQAVVSTGPTTLPTWGAPTFTYPSQAANTDLANTTGSSAVPTAVAIPSCSTSSSAIDYTSGTGWGCNTSINAATLGGTTFAAPGPIGSTTASTGAFTTLSASGTVSGSGFSTYLASPPAIGSTSAAAGSFTNLSSSGAVSGTGFTNYLASPPAIGGTSAAAGAFTTLSASGLISPTSTVGIKGTTTNDSAPAGSWGELGPASTTSVSMTNNSPANCTSKSLTAGQWMVMGVVQFMPSAASPTQLIMGSSSTSATLPSVGQYASIQPASGSLSAGGTEVLPSPPQIFQLASTTTIYLIGQMAFSSGTATCSGYITAFRMR
jgi:hypothetical protein